MFSAVKVILLILPFVSLGIAFRLISLPRLSIAHAQAEGELRLRYIYALLGVNLLTFFLVLFTSQ
jgi:hypothetical protein